MFLAQNTWTVLLKTIKSLLKTEFCYIKHILFSKVSINPKIINYTFRYTRGMPQTLNLFFKNCVFFLTCLNFSHLQNILLLMQYIYWDIFSTAQNHFQTRQFWRLLVLLLLFCFTSSASAKRFPLRTFFIHKQTKKVTWGEIRWIGRVGHHDYAVFAQKLLSAQCSVGRCTCKSPVMKWANTLREVFKKNSLMPNIASHNNAS